MLSKRIANITPSATHAMTARIAEKCAAGESIITFSIGEPDFPTCIHIEERHLERRI